MPCDGAGGPAPGTCAPPCQSPLTAAGAGGPAPPPFEPPASAPCHPLLTACEGPVAPPPPEAWRHPPLTPEFRSSREIVCGAATSSVLNPCSCAHVRASPPTPSASRIFCVAATILSTAVRLAFAASALQRACTANASANCSGVGFFEARISSISLLPLFAISANLLRRKSMASAPESNAAAFVRYFSARSK